MGAALRAPRRIPRTRKRFFLCPPGAVYVGRPTWWSNPFQREGIAHARSVILYRAWLQGELTAPIMMRLRFSTAEIEGLIRWRRRLVGDLPLLAGRDLQCWCPLTSPWCHADVLLAVANDNAIQAARTVA